MKLLKHPFVHWLALVTAIFLVIAYLMSHPSLPSVEPQFSKPIVQLPDFTQYKDVKKKKTAFFDFLYPVVEEENRTIRMLRQHLLQLESDYNENSTLSDGERNWLTSLATTYGIDEADSQEIPFDELRKRVDIIPPSLVLSQAAIESGWGTSRFAKQGNNLFGQWCFKKGCGIVPAHRSSEKQHEVARFDSVNNAIRAYMRNLNSFQAYEEFRKRRSDSSTNRPIPEVSSLIQGLSSYSEQGQAYLKKVSTLIRQNKLSQIYDQRFLKQLQAQ